MYTVILIKDIYAQIYVCAYVYVCVCIYMFIVVVV